jgi:hypothetical protein
MVRDGNSADFGEFHQLGKGGMAWVAILLPPPPHIGNCSFLPLSPYLNDICLIFLLFFLSLNTALLFDVYATIMGWILLAVQL